MAGLTRLLANFSLLMSLILSGSLAGAQEMNVKVMSLNVWGVDAQTAKLAEIVTAGGADVVGLQEMNLSSGRALASELGWYFHQQSNNRNQIISRYAVVGESADNRGVQIELTPGHNAWLFNTHLTAYPYQPYDLRDNPGLTEAQLIASAENTRGGEIDTYLSSIAATTTGTERVFFTGDFNEPSHLDWTQEVADATDRNFDIAVRWPGSEKVQAAGFTDSFRNVRNNPISDPGYTWTPGTPPGNIANNEVHDRIDFVYYRGNNLTAIGSQTVGLDPTNINTDIAVAGYNTDHRAVVSEFVVTELEGTNLSFSRLDHNPGNDSALVAGGYGDRLVTSQNIELDFSVEGDGNWDTYDGDEDANGFNGWNVGVAQLQSSSLGTVFDIEFNPDDGFGVLLESFDLVDYIDFAEGHTVEWELWRGTTLDGVMLADGEEMIAADMRNEVLTNYETAEFGLVTLRLRQTAGDGTDLALDNLRFFQVTAIPEPSAVLLIGLGAFGFCVYRRKPI